MCESRMSGAGEGGSSTESVASLMVPSAGRGLGQRRRSS